MSGSTLQHLPKPIKSQTIWVAITADEDGNEVREYTDKLGRVILKRVQKATSNADGRANWLSTYYVYDDFGNLRFVIPPKAEQVLSDANWSWNTTDMNELVFQYTYDGRNRMISKRVPDQVYQKWSTISLDRLVASRDANLAALNQWLITKYDIHNRPVITGLYTISGSTQTSLQTDVNTWNNDIFVRTEALNTDNTVEGLNLTLSHHISGTQVYRAKNGGEINFLPGFDSNGEYFETEFVVSLNHEYTFYQGYYDASFPTIDDDFEVLSISYFDNYDFTSKAYNSGQEVGFYTAGTNNAVDPAVDTNVKGIATGSRVKVLGSEDQWLTSIMFYDDRGRVIQTVATNHLGGEDISTTQYDFGGKVLNTYTVHKNPKASGSDTQTTVAKRMTYDHAGRLLTIQQKLNGASSYKTLVAHTYNNLGELEVKTLGNGLESLTHKYNVRGWLESINKQYVDNGTGGSFFGMELSYDFGFTEKQYNGNIAGIKWRSQGNSEIMAYGFDYDQTNRLLEADYTQGTGWTQPQNFSTEYSYDENGNIETLKRYGNVEGTSLLIDNLTYTYLNNDKSNQLAEVDDAAGDLGQSDFVDGNTSGNDYTYDDNGNMKKDLNKDVTNITYNHLNLPEVVSFTSNRSITYAYDAAGIKLSKTTNNNGNLTTTDYASGFIYENNQLQHFAHEEGRVRKNDSGELVYDYFIKDHLGNTRVTLTEESVTSQYLATMEAEYRDFETNESLGLGFGNISTSNTEVNAMANTTVDQFNELASPVPNTVLRTNGSYSNLRVGASKMIKVMATDVVNITARATTGSVDNGNNSSAITAAILSQTFGGATSNTGGAEGAIFNQFNNNYSDILSAFGSQNGSMTDAYLNWILFDEDFNVVNSGTGFDQVSASASKETLTSGNITIPSSGFFYVYLK